MASSAIVIIIAVAAALVFGIAGFVAGNLYRKKTSEAKIGSAEEQAKKIVSDAISQAESKKKEAILEAKDEIHKQRTETEPGAPHHPEGRKSGQENRKP